MLVFLAMIAAQTPPTSNCQYDKPAMMALDERAFDQAMTGGWRTLAAAGCDAQAADLIAEWRAVHPANPRTVGLLQWHEGQLRANAGQTARAVALFEAARKPAEEDAGFGWNLYVDGSIAFLRRDLTGLETARAKLAALPLPTGYSPVGADGKPRAFGWPMNLNILDGFVACWNQPYKQAYGCAKPPVKTLPPA